MARIFPIPFLFATSLMLAACGGRVDGDSTPTSASAPPVASTTDAHQSAVPPPVQPAVVLDWGNLDAALGKYATDIDYFAPGPIADALRDLLGDDIGRLQDNLAVAGPLQRERGVYYVTGNAPHRGGVDQAYVLMDPSQRALEVGLWRSGTLEVYVTPGAADIDKPADVTTMIDNADQAPATSASAVMH